MAIYSFLLDIISSSFPTNLVYLATYCCLIFQDTHNSLSVLLFIVREYMGFSPIQRLHKYRYYLSYCSRNLNIETRYPYTYYFKSVSACHLVHSFADYVLRVSDGRHNGWHSGGE